MSSRMRNSGGTARGIKIGMPQLEILRRTVVISMSRGFLSFIFDFQGWKELLTLARVKGVKSTAPTLLLV